MTPKRKKKGGKVRTVKRDSAEMDQESAKKLFKVGKEGGRNGGVAFPSLNLRKGREVCLRNKP